jgi:hypothetical protein
MDDLTEASLRDFRAAFRGAVIQSEDATYERARRIFNARFDRHPGLIARPADAKAVATAVQFARAEDLVTAVRGGGHSYAGHSTCDGGLVIDLSQMKELQIDPAGGVARISPPPRSRPPPPNRQPPSPNRGLGGLEHRGRTVGSRTPTSR